MRNAAARNFALFALIVVAIAASTLAIVTTSGSPKTAAPKSGAETVCVSNFAQQYISDKQILNAIPAWTKALNVDFASYWHSAHYRFVFLGSKRAWPGCISAEFLSKGPIKGALAYHWTERGNAPSITVYAGTGDYYGFDNNVSMTHELEEMAADPVTSAINQGYPSAYFWLEDKKLSIQPVDNSQSIGWFQEVSDPVEADSYCRPGANGQCVKISDFVTPSWFNDGVGGRYDFMGLCQQPLWIRPGGYAQYLDAAGWNIVENFRKGHASDAGFSKGDPDPSKS